jgi:acetylornithine deacetylase/succinyl-diaminopimelate desuccinylase-like protein
MSEISDRLVDLAIQIQQIPAPTFKEGQRAEFVRRRFVDEGLNDVSVDDLGNVYGCLPVEQSGGAPGARDLPSKDHVALIISAHMDTVFSKETDLTAKKENGRVHAPGIGDNSLGVAALIGLIWALREKAVRRKDDIWLVANVCEEGLGNLKGMQAVADRFAEKVRGYLVLEGLAFGHVYNRAVGVRRYRIRATTRGGHAWSDYGQPSAVHEIAGLIHSISHLQPPGEPRSTLNVGTVRGGTGINVLAAEAECELDVRSESRTVLEVLARQVEALVKKANRETVKVDWEIIGERPAGNLDVTHPFIQSGLRAVQAQGLEAVLTSGSTDANIPLSRGYPAVVLGMTTGGGAHTLKEFIDIGPIEKGLEQLVKFVELVSSD